MPNTIEETPLITKIEASRMDKNSSKIVRVIVKTEDDRLVLKISENAARKLQDKLAEILLSQNSE